MKDKKYVDLCNHVEKFYSKILRNIRIVIFSLSLSVAIDPRKYSCYRSDWLFFSLSTLINQSVMPLNWVKCSWWAWRRQYCRIYSCTWIMRRYIQEPSFNVSALYLLPLLQGGRRGIHEAHQLQQSRQEIGRHGSWGSNNLRSIVGNLQPSLMMVISVKILKTKHSGRNEDAGHNFNQHVTTSYHSVIHGYVRRPSWESYKMSSEKQSQSQ